MVNFPRKICHVKFPRKFQVGKNIKTPQTLHGILSRILHGITKEHDWSPWSYSTECFQGQFHLGETI